MRPYLAGCAALILSSTILTVAQSVTREREVAATFAPVFYQALGDKPRSDYITNFDFDGDWRGDNNWEHAEDQQFSLKAFIYYSVAETETHFFIHYAVFHPRDYKGGERKGAILSELIREGTKRGGKYDPTGLAEEAALAHENDMEGCLVVVAKQGSDISRGRIAFVETLHHNNFSRYLPLMEVPKGFSTVKLDGQRPLLYIEPKGHGIEAYTGDQKQTGTKDFVIYRATERAEDPTGKDDVVCHHPDLSECSRSVGYGLVPLQTLWNKARDGVNATFGTVCDFKDVVIDLSRGKGSLKKKIKAGKLGCAFLGRVGGQNMARPPWAWFDKDERERQLGLWFFDPARVVKLDFGLGREFSTAYLRLPFWAASR
jgi:hypothetical protein